MKSLQNILNLKEGVSLEAKKAVGGLPNSLWETYSAFANTEGGIILLGVEEDKKRNLKVVGVGDSEQMLSDFWNQINNPQKVSVNILTRRHVVVEEIDGKKVVVIRVPRAERGDKPVFLNRNLLDGSYRRNGEGDYKCTHEDVKAMLRDAAVQTHDTRVLEEMPLKVFDFESIRRYRTRMQYTRPGHVWSGIEDIDFLHKLGCVGRGKDGQLHPTAAGLLMFGFEYEIVREYPEYFLDYREQDDPRMRWTDRIHSSSGEWSGNVFDFYFRVYNRLSQALKVPFKLEGITRIDDTPMHKALREVLANCLINADYCGRRGVVIVKDLCTMSFANPGGLRIDKEVAIAGGVSDPRNGTLMKMFNLIDIGERAGSGLPGIFDVWQKSGLEKPTITETFSPDRCVVVLSNPKDLDKLQCGIDSDTRNVPVNDADVPVNDADAPVNNANIPVNNADVPVNDADVHVNDGTKPDSPMLEDKIIDVLRKNNSLTLDEIAELLTISRKTVQRKIVLLKAQGNLERVGSDKSGYWKVLV